MEETKIINKINELPTDIINFIKEFIPNKVLIFTNKTNYLLYHHLLTGVIKNYEAYIKDIIKRDNEFVLNIIIYDDFVKWNNITQYMYKYMKFKNFLYFVINYCIEHDSINCITIITEYIKEHGLGKYLYKKNVVKYIRWKD